MHTSDDLFDALFPPRHLVSSLRLDLTATRWHSYKEPLYRHAYSQMSRLADVLLLSLNSWYNPSNWFDNSRVSHHLATFMLTYQDTIMPQRKSTRNEYKKPEWKGFLERRLTQAELDACDAWKPKPVDLFEALSALLASGFRVTLSYSAATKVASCTIIDDDASRTTAGYALGSQDSDAPSALKLALYKHFTALDGDWSVLMGATPSTRRG